MLDSGKGPKPLGIFGLPTRAASNGRATTWASDDVLPALSGRAAQLETLARSLQADLERATERLAAYSDFDERLEHALADAYRGAQKIQQEARDEADRTLQRALDECRLVLTERDRLRDERDGLASEIARAKRTRLAPMRALPAAESISVPDRRAMVAEMRPILEALIREAFGPRPAPTQMKPHMQRSTLLRTPLPSMRTRRPASTPPVRRKKSATAPVPPPAGDLAPPVAVPAAEVIVPVVPIIPAAPDVGEEIAARSEALAVMPLVEEPVDVSAPVVDMVESPAITAPDDAAAVADAPVADVIAEASADRTELDPRVIALQLVDVAPPVVHEPPAPEVELAIEVPELEMIESALDEMLPVAELRQVSAEPEIAEHVEAAPPADPQDVIEFIAPVQPVAEPEVLEPFDAETATEAWESAINATLPTVAVPEGSDAFLTSPFELETEPPLQVEPAVIEPTQAEGSPPLVEAMPTPATAEPAINSRTSARELQLVLSPITSFPQLLSIQRRIASLSSVNALHLRDFRNGVATFVASVTDALSGREFGSVLQMLTELQLRLEGATEDSVELRVGPQPT